MYNNVKQLLIANTSILVSLKIKKGPTPDLEL